MHTLRDSLMLTALAFTLWNGSQTSAQQQLDSQLLADQRVQAVNPDPRLSQVLGFPTSHCGHVIDLLRCNHFRQHAGYRPCEAHGLSPVFYGQAPGDLELVSVHLISDGDAQQCPVYQVCLRNCSRLPVEDFRISVVGILGRIEVTSPTATVRVARLDAGQTENIQIQLPATAMAMGPAGQQPVPFDTLVVAIDSFDELIESNELNNVAILKREEIAPVVVEPAPVAADVAPEETVPSEGTTPNLAPSEESTPSPLDEIDLDNLDLGDADEAAIRID